MTTSQEVGMHRRTRAEPPRRAAGNPIGFGRMPRKEDARFLRGQGNYVDDVIMPGMLHSRDPAQPVRARPDPVRSTPPPRRRCPGCMR